MGVTVGKTTSSEAIPYVPYITALPNYRREISVNIKGGTGYLSYRLTSRKGYRTMYVNINFENDKVNSASADFVGLLSELTIRDVVQQFGIPSCIFLDRAIRNSLPESQLIYDRPNEIIRIRFPYSIVDWDAGIDRMDFSTKANNQRSPCRCRNSEWSLETTHEGESIKIPAFDLWDVVAPCPGPN
jgi:hypothetical protein